MLQRKLYSGPLGARGFESLSRNVIPAAMRVGHAMQQALKDAQGRIVLQICLRKLYISNVFH